MKFTVTGEEVVTSMTDKGEWKRRQLTLLGVDDLNQQFCEMNLPADSPAVGVGKQVDIHIRKILQLYQGNARLLGDVAARK